jgi:hypothetical protein
VASGFGKFSLPLRVGMMDYLIWVGRAAVNDSAIAIAL